ncbi:MAG: hypothetical protein OHK0045_05500 [Raineya sp.]
MLKIALLNNSESWGGLEINTVYLAKWLYQAGNEVCFICVKNSQASQLVDAYKIPTITSSKKLEKTSLYSVYKLAQELKKKDCKYLIVAHSQDIYLASYLKVLMKDLKIIHIQQMYVGVNKKDLLHRVFYKNIDVWVSPLPYLKENTLQNTPIPENKIHIIPLCIEVEKFVKPKDKSEMREQFHLPMHKKIVGIIGRIDEGKGQEYVIEALAQVRAKGYDIDALIMGNETKGKENTYLLYLKNLAEKLQVASFVHFREHFQEVEQAYAALDFFVVASLEETYGMVTIEAMASRLPVIGVATFGTKDLIMPEKTGLYCQPKDAPSIAEALIRLLENPHFAEQLAQQAQAEVQKKYKHQAAVEAITKLLQSL